MIGSRGIVWMGLGGGIVAIAGIWLVLEVRARESERVRAERSSRKEPVLPRASKPAVTEKRAGTPPREESPTLVPDIERRAETPRPERVKTEEQKALEAKLPGFRRPEPGEIPGLQAKAQDLSADPKERLTALTRLRVASPDGRSPEVVRSMIDLLRTSSEASIREDLCRQLKGIQSEELKAQLLIVVRTENHTRTRQEAVESLGPMRKDPAVRQALQTILTTDPDERVRNEAKRSLTGGR